LILGRESDILGVIANQLNELVQGLPACCFNKMSGQLGAQSLLPENGRIGIQIEKFRVCVGCGSRLAR
jgi:hypothetical protein